MASFWGVPNTPNTTKVSTQPATATISASQPSQISPARCPFCQETMESRYHCAMHHSNAFFFLLNQQKYPEEAILAGRISQQHFAQAQMLDAKAISSIPDTVASTGAQQPLTPPSLIPPSLTPPSTPKKVCISLDKNKIGNGRVNRTPLLELPSLDGPSPLHVSISTASQPPPQPVPSPATSASHATSVAQQSLQPTSNQKTPSTSKASPSPLTAQIQSLQASAAKRASQSTEANPPSARPPAITILMPKKKVSEIGVQAEIVLSSTSDHDSDRDSGIHCDSVQKASVELGVQTDCIAKKSVGLQTKDVIALKRTIDTQTSDSGPLISMTSSSTQTDSLADEDFILQLDESTPTRDEDMRCDASPSPIQRAPNGLQQKLYDDTDDLLLSDIRFDHDLLLEDLAEAKQAQKQRENGEDSTGKGVAFDENEEDLLTSYNAPLMVPSCLKKTVAGVRSVESKEGRLVITKRGLPSLNVKAEKPPPVPTVKSTVTIVDNTVGKVAPRRSPSPSRRRSRSRGSTASRSSGDTRRSVECRKARRRHSETGSVSSRSSRRSACGSLSRSRSRSRSSRRSGSSSRRSDMPGTKKAKKMPSDSEHKSRSAKRKKRSRRSYSRSYSRSRSRSSSSRATYDSEEHKSERKPPAADRARFLCDVCHEGPFDSPKDVAEHEVEVHGNLQADFPCCWCRFRAPTTDQVTDHMKSIHPYRDFPLRCGWCQEVLAEKVNSSDDPAWSDLRRHLEKEYMRKRFYSYERKQHSRSFGHAPHYGNNGHSSRFNGGGYANPRATVAPRGLGSCPHGPPMPCKNFPNCPGMYCYYSHGPCRYDFNCAKPECPYDHTAMPRTCLTCLRGKTVTSSKSHSNGHPYSKDKSGGGKTKRYD